jgi:hypothetical protein
MLWASIGCTLVSERLWSPADPTILELEGVWSAKMKPALSSTSTYLWGMLIITASTAIVGMFAYQKAAATWLYHIQQFTHF